MVSKSNVKFEVYHFVSVTQLSYYYGLTSVLVRLRPSSSFQEQLGQSLKICNVGAVREGDPTRGHISDKLSL